MSANFAVWTESHLRLVGSSWLGFKRQCRTISPRKITTTAALQGEARLAAAGAKGSPLSGLAGNNMGLSMGRKMNDIGSDSG